MSKGIRMVVAAQVSPVRDIHSHRHGAVAWLAASMRQRVLDTQPPHCYTDMARLERNRSIFNDF
jgi:hypothetical protein